MIPNFQANLYIMSRYQPEHFTFFNGEDRKALRQSCWCLLHPCSEVLAKRFRVCQGLGAFLESIKKHNTFRETEAGLLPLCCSAVPTSFHKLYTPFSSARGSVPHLPPATLHSREQPPSQPCSLAEPLALLWKCCDTWHISSWENKRH